MGHEEIRSQIRDFIRKNFIFDASTPLQDGQSLLGTGVVDSTGILELISYLEGSYQLKFADSDLVADNFDSIDRIVSFVSPKVKQTKG
jgi:acyl carrier protein